MAEILGLDLLAAKHLIVAGPQQDYPLSSTPPVRIVNGFLYRSV